MGQPYEITMGQVRMGRWSPLRGRRGVKPPQGQLNDYKNRLLSPLSGAGIEAVKPEHFVRDSENERWDGVRPIFKNCDLLSLQR